MAESIGDGSVLVDPPSIEPREIDESVRTPTESDPPDTAAPGLPLDQKFEILRNQRRRHVLRFLSEADGPLRLGDLSERIAALENDKEVVEISSSERKRVYVGLYQCHLPKMDGMDVIAFNKPRGVIEAGPTMDQLEEYLADDTRDEAAWPLYYAAASIGGAILLGVAGAGSSWSTAPMAELAGGLVVLSFFCLSVFHFWHWRGQTTADSSGQPASTE
jgi:hypothetical protein